VRRAKLNPQGQLSIRRQCALLSLNRSTAYYEAVPTPDEDLALMRVVDELYTARPIYGSRKMSERLRERGHVVNRKRVQRLMRLMGLVGLAPRRSTSRPHPAHAKYPYLLRGVEVVRANQVWAADITYIPMARGFVYLVAIIDWYSRMVLAWRLSNTMDASSCVDALEEALHRYGAPEIFNTDQGSQFTADEFIAVVERSGAKVSMDGKGSRSPRQSRLRRRRSWTASTESDTEEAQTRAELSLTSPLPWSRQWGPPLTPQRIPRWCASSIGRRL
jgi:putative transposase